MSQSNTNGFLIAALGASAGGLEALEKFFKHMPADAGITFAVVQHLAPDHASALPELLARHTRMTVGQVRYNAKIAPNRAYYSSECHADDQGLHVARGETGRASRPPNSHR